MPKALSEGYRRVTGKPIVQAWGMTETSPIASVFSLKSTLEGLERGRSGPTCGPRWG